MFSSRLPATIVCLVALAASAVLVQWTANEQEASGRTSLTAAARRRLADDARSGPDALLLKVVTDIGGRNGHTEAMVVESFGRGRVAGERLVLEWVRPVGGEWQAVGPPRHR